MSKDSYMQDLRQPDPENIIPRYVTSKSNQNKRRYVFAIEKYSNIYSVAFGKAGDSMTRALNKIIPVKVESL